METYMLNNNVEIPKLGIGTFKLTPKEAYESVKYALTIEYRLIDTAAYYENEVAVGNAIIDSHVDRKEIFVSTKIWPSYYEDDEAIDKTLKRLKLDYIDLLFLHQPCGNYIHAYKNLEKAYLEGKIKAIGLSNFEGKEFDEIMKIATIKPQVVQVELHPYYQQKELRKKLEKYNIKLMSWYPLGHGDKELLREPILSKIGNPYFRTNAQILIRWQIDHDFIVIPGSKDLDHISSNFGIFDFRLTNADIERIDSLDKNKRYYQKSDEKYKKYETLVLNLDNQEEK